MMKHDRELFMGNDVTIRNFFHILSLQGMRFMGNKPHIFFCASFIKTDKYKNGQGKKQIRLYVSILLKKRRNIFECERYKSSDFAIFETNSWKIGKEKTKKAIEKAK